MPKNDWNPSWEARKSSPEASKIEPGSLQDVFFKHIYLKSPPKNRFRKVLGPKCLTWLQVGGPRGFKIEAKTLKNRCWKTTHFQHRFWRGSELVLEEFLVGFLEPKCMPKAKHWIVWNINKTLRGRTFFWCWLLQQASKLEQKSMKNSMFFGTSILDGFWEGFGKVLGSQNPWFSHFFRCFFEAFFQQFLGRPKNRKKRPRKAAYHSFWDGLAECAASRGEKKRGGEGLRCRIYRSRLDIEKVRQEEDLEVAWYI